MSSQGQGITVQHAPDPRGYRLIELPLELQSLLESDDPPLLKLDSTDTSAVLRSPHKSYALRQKNTSNAMMLLSPHSPAADSTDQRIAVVATIRETVELEPVPEKLPGVGALKHTGSKGKWHEKFGRGR